MKKLKEHAINKQNLFIDGYYIDKKVCDNLVDFYESDKVERADGVTGRGTNETIVNKDIKDSTDVSIFWPRQIYENFEVNDYCESMDVALNQYCEKWTMLKNGGHFTMHTMFNVQKYNPTQGYHVWHCERNDIGVTKRMLVFMTYLNDVTEGGETAFLYQKTKIKPEKGLTLFWPSDWTHTHKGVMSHTQTKYIATGWYMYTQLPAGQGGLEWI